MKKHSLLLLLASAIFASQAWAADCALTEMCLYSDGGCWPRSGDENCQNHAWVFCGGTPGGTSMCIGGTFTGEGRDQTPPTTPLTPKGCCKWASTGKCNTMYSSQEVTDCDTGLNSIALSSGSCPTEDGSCSFLSSSSTVNSSSSTGSTSYYCKLSTGDYCEPIVESKLIPTITACITIGGAVVNDCSASILSSSSVTLSSSSGNSSSSGMSSSSSSFGISSSSTGGTGYYCKLYPPSIYCELITIYNLIPTASECRGAGGVVTNDCSVSILSSSSSMTSSSSSGTSSSSNFDVSSSSTIYSCKLPPPSNYCELMVPGHLITTALECYASKGEVVADCFASPILNISYAAGLTVFQHSRSLQISSAQESRVQLFDMRGERVLNANVPAGQATLNLEKQKLGVYYAVISSGSNKQTVKVVLK